MRRASNSRHRTSGASAVEAVAASNCFTTSLERISERIRSSCTKLPASIWPSPREHHFHLVQDLAVGFLRLGPNLGTSLDDSRPFPGRLIGGEALLPRGGGLEVRPLEIGHDHDLAGLLGDQISLGLAGLLEGILIEALELTEFLVIRRQLLVRVLALAVACSISLASADAWSFSFVS